MAANDCAVDHVLPVVGKPEIDQRLEYRIPHALLGPSPETDIDRVPLSIALMHVAPGATNPQNMKHAIQEPPIVVRWPRFAASLGRQKLPDDRPLRVRHIPSTQRRLQKAVLNQRFNGLGIHYVNTA